jgi:probable rRNA maturation factor
MILNRQSKARVDLPRTAALARRLSRVLGLGRRRFNVCFVDDEQIRALNVAHRHKSKATDVLSFPWQPGRSPGKGRSDSAMDPDGEFDGFLGDVVISVETARRNAESEGHTSGTEISWLMVHGLLHLLGMDHETDNGEMAALEQDLRERLRLS